MRPALACALLVAGCAASSSRTPDVIHVRVDAAAPRGRIVAIAPARFHTCVLDDASAVWCWDHRARTPAEDLGYVAAEPVRAAVPPPIARLEAGDETVCALTNEGAVYCWGDVVPIDQRAPVRPEAAVRLDLPPATDVRLSNEFGAALLSDGSVRLWSRRGLIETREPIPPMIALGNGEPGLVGMSRDGQLVSFEWYGQVRMRSYSGPDPRRLVGTRYDRFILGEDGAFYHLSMNTRDTQLEPISLPGVLDVVAGMLVCARTSHGVFCRAGMTGYEEWVPVAWENPRSISAGPLRVCAISESQGVLCWNRVGERANFSRLEWRETGPVEFVPHQTEEIAPQAVCGSAPSGLRTVEVATGYGHGCALFDDGTVRCWGLNGSGQAGRHASVEQRSPVPVSFDSPVAHLYAGMDGTCAIDHRARVLCLGQAVDGGYNGDPQVIAVRGQAREVAIGRNHTCVLLENGQVHCWGRNERGEVGDGSTTARRSPVRVRQLPRAERIAAGDSITCAIADGAVHCWGGEQMSRAPLRIQGLPAQRAIDLAIAGSSVCALLEEGTVWCWGEGGDGQLGPRGGAGSATPVSIDAPPAIAIAGGGTQLCARTREGAVHCWGRSSHQDAAPAAVRAIEWIEPATQLAVGHRAACIVARDGGGACCWGERLATGRGEVGPPGPIPPGPVVW